MSCAILDGRTGRASTLLTLAIFLAFSSQSWAQGCFPIRYTSPTLSRQTSSPQAADQWEMGIAYRFLHAERFYIGHDYHPESAPGGQPSRINISTAELSLSYAPTSRVTMTLAVPFASGTQSRLQDDKLRHQLSATGFGDVSLVGAMW